jgi:hypothetical protein
MEAARGQPVLPCALHERSSVEALAGLLTLDLPNVGCPFSGGPALLDLN